MGEHPSSGSSLFDAPLSPRVARVASFARLCFAFVSAIFAYLNWVNMSRPSFAPRFNSLASQAGFAVMTANNCKFAITFSTITLTYALLRNGPYRGLVIVILAISQTTQIPPTWSMADRTSPTIWGIAVGLICLGIALTIGESIWIIKSRRRSPSSESGSMSQPI